MSSVMVGMSGGVDSSVAAALLQRQGHRVAGVTMRLWKETGDNTKEVEDAAQVCRSLGIPHSSQTFALLSSRGASSSPAKTVTASFSTGMPRYSGEVKNS